jgi:hypothetical protein
MFCSTSVGCARIPKTCRSHGYSIQLTPAARRFACRRPPACSSIDAQAVLNANLVTLWKFYTVATVARSATILKYDAVCRHFTQKRTNLRKTHRFSSADHDLIERSLRERERVLWLYAAVLDRVYGAMLFKISEKSKRWW